MSRILYPIRAEPVLTDAQRPEQVTESRWHQPLSQPVRRGGLIAAAIVASGLAVAPVYVPLVPTDGWVAPISQPVRRLVRPQPAAFSYSYNTPASIEVVTLDKWFVPLAAPRFPRGLAVSRQRTLAFYPLPLVAPVTHELAAALLAIAVVEALPTSSDDDILDAATLIYVADLIVGTVATR